MIWYEANGIFWQCACSLDNADKFQFTDISAEGFKIQAEKSPSY